MTNNITSIRRISAPKATISFLVHAEKTILRHNQELRTLCAHPRKVVSRKARQFYAQQLFLHRIHQELSDKVRNHFPSLDNTDREQVLSEVALLEEMQFRLASRFFRFVNRNRVTATVATQLVKIA